MIPLYSLFTPSHRVFSERYFEPTLPSGLELRMRFLDIEGEGFIHDASWQQAIVAKVQVILEAIRQHDGGAFVYSDVDVQFFRPIETWFERALAEHDIAFQPDAPGPALCAGFFFCRANAVTHAFWRKVLLGVRASGGREHDQDVARRLVWSMEGLRFRCLPPVFFGGGTFTGRIWTPGDALELPEGILVHHANFTLGIANKVLQLEHVRAQAKQGRFVPFAESCRLIGLAAE